MTAVTPRAGGPSGGPKQGTKVKRLPPSDFSRAIFNPLWPVAFGLGLICANPDPVRNLWSALASIALSLVMMFMLRPWDR